MSDDLNLQSIDNLALMLGDVNEIIEINLTDIIPDPNQPRKDRDLGKDKELAQSIAENGVLQAIVVKQKDDLGRHMIAFGHRRFDASIEANLSTIPCVIKDIDDSELLSIQAIENIQREDMSLADEIEVIAKISSQYGVKKTSKVLGKSSQYVSKRVRIYKSDKYIIDFIKMGFSNDISAYYELSLLDSNYPNDAKKLVDLWITDSTIRTSLRNQIEGIKKSYLDKKEDKNVVDLTISKKETDKGNVDNVKKNKSIISEKEKRSNSVKNQVNKIIKSFNMSGEPDNFKINSVGNKTLLSFIFDDGENIEINITEDLWSQFVDEINKR